MQNEELIKKICYIFKVILFELGIRALLLINKMLIKLLPFKTVINWFSGDGSVVIINSKKSSQVKTIKRSIDHVLCTCLWHPKCYEQALTVMVIGRCLKIPVSIHFGIKRQSDYKIAAHAWSELGSELMTGEKNAPEYSKLYTLRYGCDENEEK